MRSLRLALLISGGGTTATAIIKACVSGELSGIEPVCVISGKHGAEGIVRVQEAGISKDRIYVLSAKQFASEDQFAQALLTVFKDHQIDLIGQYGWMTKTPAVVIHAYQNMLINQHPGPLDPGRPDFGSEGMFGMRVCTSRLLFVQRTQHDYWTEVVAQRVAVNFDEGAVIKMARVPIFENDTPEVLSARMLPVEHQLQIETLRDFANGTVKEIVRATPLIAPHEFSILAEVKQQAAMMYPKG